MAAPTIDTFNAYTQTFWPSPKLVDIAFRGTPVFEYLKRGARRMGGKSMTFDVEYARLGGASRALGGQMTMTTPEIGTQGTLPWRYYYVPVLLEQARITMNKTDPQAAASYLNRYIASAANTMREKHLAVDIFTAQTGTHLDSIIDAVNDTTPYAGIARGDTGMTGWSSVVAEPIYADTPDSPVSPSLTNFKKMLRVIKRVSSFTPDLIVTTGDVYDVLTQQILANDRLSGTRNKNMIEWGFSAFDIDGVPVVDDANCPGAAFVNGASRAADYGHSAYFLNFDFLYMGYLPGWFMDWSPMGWQTPVDYTQYINSMHFAGNIICNNRRAQGVMFGIDPTQTPDNWTTCTIDETRFAVV